MNNRFEALIRVRSIADYQFGKGVGEILFPDNVKIVFSKRTGRIRHIYSGSELLSTLRPRDGLLSLTIAGAKRLLIGMKPLRLWVKVQREVGSFIARGRNVFAKHVVDADENIRPQEETIVIDEDGKILAVGKALLTGKEMKLFSRGVAVHVRRGVAEENKSEKV